MDKIIKKSWISFYIYYNPPYDKLLISVFSLIQKLKKQKILEKYFFIRYWENGPHLRLRLLVKAENRSRVIQLSKKHINTFLKKTPSDYPHTKKYPEFQNEVKLIKYEPEFERYGGKESIQISESQFQLSSQIVFKILNNYGDLSYDHSFYSALKYHILLIKSFGVVKKDAEILLTHFTNLWVNSILNRYPGYDSIENIMKKFDNLYAAQKTVFDAMIDQIKCEYKKKEKLSEFWVSNIKKIHLLLKKTNNFQIDTKFIYNDASTRERYINNLLPSYIHMMNNRLGIPNQDEAFISYLIKKYINNILND
jgi:thiopeptide-type bacteriocin biosynthesis protein